MKNWFKKILFLFCLFSIFYLPKIAFALEINYPNLPPPFDALSPNNFLRTAPQEAFPLFIKYIYSLLLWLGTATAFIIFAWGGLLFVTARNNPNQIASAREKLSAAFFGFLILLSSYLILSTINPNLTWLALPEIKKVELPDFSAIQAPVSGEYKTSIQVELPFGTIIERLFNKNKKWQDYTEEEKKLFEKELEKEKDKHFTKLILDVSEKTIEIAKELLKNARGPDPEQMKPEDKDFKGLKQLSEECSCSNAKPRCDAACEPIPNKPPLTVGEGADDEAIRIIEKYNKGSSCSGDPCKEKTRKKIIELEEKTKELIDEKFKKELLKQKVLSAIIGKELKKIELVEDFIKKCPLELLDSLRNLGITIDNFEKNNWYVDEEKKERWFIWDFEIWKDLNKPKNQKKIFDTKDPASFYCPVSGNIHESSLYAGAGGSQEDEFEKKVEAADAEGKDIEFEEDLLQSCEVEIPVGETIDRAKRLANRLIERIEKMFRLSQQLIKEVDNLQVLISQCSSQVPRCKSDCKVVSDACVQKCIADEEGPCPKSKIEETIKKIEELIEVKKEPASVPPNGEDVTDKEGIKNIFDTSLEKEKETEEEEKERKVGIKQLIEEISQDFLKELDRKVRYGMETCVIKTEGEDYPELANCKMVKGARGGISGYIEKCCVPQKKEEAENSEEKEGDSFEKCLQKCYLESGFQNKEQKKGDKYKKCLTDCLNKEAQEKKAEEIGKCNHFINFYCCR